MSTPITQLFDGELNVVNVGLAMFENDIAAQGAKVTGIDWAPPGSSKPEVIAALDLLARPDVAARIEAANAEAVERITSAKPMLIGFGRAIDVVPGAAGRPG
ncbi:hypothetical protein [Streptomyces sp. NPDC002559]